MSDNLININIVIADRPYPLRIKPEEEERVRNAAKEINNRVKQFQNQYAAKDKQDYLAMSALMYAVEAASFRDKITIEDSTFIEKLDELDALLAGAVSS